MSVSMRITENSANLNNSVWKKKEPVRIKC